MSPRDVPSGKPAGAVERKAEQPAPGQEPHVATSQISSAGEASIAGAGPPKSAVPDTLRNLGRYRILSRLGHGGMGSVWLADDTQLQRKVALKIPQIPDDDSCDWIDRFYREARAAATIHHSHLCPV